MTTAALVLIAAVVGIVGTALIYRPEVMRLRTERDHARAKLADALPLPRFDAHEWQRLGSEAVDQAMRGVEL